MQDLREHQKPLFHWSKEKEPERPQEKVFFRRRGTSLSQLGHGIFTKELVVGLVIIGLFLFITWKARISRTLPHIKAREVYSLEGDWKLKSSNGSVRLQANVPGTVHTALLKQKLIEEPFFRFGDEQVWIPQDHWTYTRTFRIPDDFLVPTKKVVLVCDGIDTVSKITINHNVIGTTENMFRRYIFDVTQHLLSENHIEVAFTSALTYAKQKHEAYPHPQNPNVIPPICPPDIQRGFCHQNFIRKEQASFSWDWGPAFAPQGIYKSIRLEAYDTAIIRDIGATSLFEQNRWTLEIDVYFESAKRISGVVVASLAETGDSEKLKVSLQPGENKYTFQMKCSDVKLWMPVGYGEPNLYTLNIRFSSMELASMHFDYKTIRVGFRTVQLVQEKVGEDQGKTFYFKINSIPVFMKGANFIPVDAFEDRVTPEYLYQLVLSAKLANMNTLRIWGGGAYPPDEFFHYADELGVMIWEEFMFACAMYPGDKEFLNNVAEEVKYQVRRLKYHASVIVWGGNNENEDAIAGNWWGVRINQDYYTGLYKMLYFDTIKNTLKTVDTSRAYLSSSPSNGYEDEKLPVDENPQNQLYGDVHYYNYYSDCWETGSFLVPRFASEYGYQSFPSFMTLKKYSIEKDWNYRSEFMDQRQRHTGGNPELLEIIRTHFDVPSEKNPVKELRGLLYLSQIAQAMCMKSQTEHYRRYKSEIDSEGRGKTMGALYWQYNDVWPGASWSSIEYGGKWKYLQYFAKNFFSPILVSPVILGKEIIVYLVSDSLLDINDATLEVNIWKWGANFIPVKSFSKPVKCQALQSVRILEYSVTQAMEDGKCASGGDCFLTFNVTAPGYPIKIQSNFLFLDKLKKTKKISNPKISIKKVVAHPHESKTFVIYLHTKAIAAFVWLETSFGGVFSDNGFLMTEKERTVTFSLWGKEVSDSEFTNSLKVTSYYELIHSID